jgi:hypothetical protein
MMIEQLNGHDLVPLHLPAQGPVSGWPQLDDPGQSRTPAGDPGRRRRIDGDTAIRVLAAFVVLAVAAFAAIVSYSHIFELGRAHGQDGAAARLLPLSVDGLIASASLVMLHAARRELSVPWLARAMLALGVGATVAANVGYGLPFGWLSAVVSAWPAVAFVGSVEMAVRFVRDARHDGTGGQDKVASGIADSPDSPPDNPGDRTADSRPDRPAARKPAPARTGRGKQDRAADIIRRNPGLDNDQVAAQAGCDARTVRRARNALAGKGTS